MPGALGEAGPAATSLDGLHEPRRLVKKGSGLIGGLVAVSPKQMAEAASHLDGIGSVLQTADLEPTHEAACLLAGGMYRATAEWCA